MRLALVVFGLCLAGCGRESAVVHVGLVRGASCVGTAWCGGSAVSCSVPGADCLVERVDGVGVRCLGSRASQEAFCP
jgi:hypothetical protein